MTNILDRIQYIATQEGITITAMERSLGASKGVLSRAINNGTDIQSKWLQVLVENYPQYSPRWLLSGKGEILLSNVGDGDTKVKTSETLLEHYRVPEHSHIGIPLIPIDAMAGALNGDVNVMEYECERYVIPAFRDADFLIRVKGDSMRPTYYAGDIVACKRVPLQDIFFQWNKVYVLDTSQGALIKRIKKGEDNEHLLIVSDNPDYEPFQLSKDQFYGVAMVCGLIRTE